MNNPFDEISGTFGVLRNDEDQYSLWPPAIAIPAGWDVVFEGGRAECVSYIEVSWTDPRPRRLRDQPRDIVSTTPTQGETRE